MKTFTLEFIFSKYAACFLAKNGLSDIFPAEFSNFFRKQQFWTTASANFRTCTTIPNSGLVNCTFWLSLWLEGEETFKYRYLNALIRKSLNIVSKNCGRTYKCDFPFSTGNTPWANFVQNIKTISLRWKLVLKPIRIWRIQWCC